MSPQHSIAHYRIVSKLGEGGMGAVYRATDTKLNRDVAIKVMPDAFAASGDRMARFEREAQLLASLNHPNIAHIYGVEQSALILELVEGPTLQQRIAQGPIPIEEALPIARQIAEALEYAHERNIVHRDLKPGNIILTLEARVKVLDFGLAKAFSHQAAAPADPANSPTVTMQTTMAGVILGTASYMSPQTGEGQTGRPPRRHLGLWRSARGNAFGPPDVRGRNRHGNTGRRDHEGAGSQSAASRDPGRCPHSPAPLPG